MHISYDSKSFAVVLFPFPASILCAHVVSHEFLILLSLSLKETDCLDE
nr:hypothetical protein Iba_chr07aCG4280 [Ipomoea batatas]GMD14239.1 hypothetical protein Iba_chr07bCG4490 [Ipomoea batatas]GMD78741.1 hypothetical protein Iba_scaffold328162CG0020 [Ipomoea batatas]